MLEGSCRCGAVRWIHRGVPDGATACNCSSCRRYGVLWIYGHEDEDVQVVGETSCYSPGSALKFHFCAVCGCLVSWRGNDADAQGRRRMAVNVRLADPATVAALPIDHFDGLDSFADLPRDGRCVADYWY